MRCLPLIYIGLIWLQSRLFDPVSIDHIPRLGTALENGHFVLFAVLYVLIVLALSTFGKLTVKKEILALIVSIICAFADEFHQYFIPHRSTTLDDIIKNLVGIAVAWLIVRLVIGIITKQS